MERDPEERYKKYKLMSDFRLLVFMIWIFEVAERIKRYTVVHTPINRQEETSQHIIMA